MNLFNLFENEYTRRNRAHTIRDLFDRWTNSEYRPFNSDSGDYNEVIRKAEHFLQDVVDPSQVERLALKLCDYWHGEDGMELDEKLGSQLVNRRQAHALITKFKRHSFEEDGTESESKREHSRGYSDAQKGIHKNPYNPHSPAHKSYEEGQQAYRRHFGESVDPQDQHKENHLAAVRAYHAKKKADKEQRSADSRGAFNNWMGGSPEDQTDFMNIRKKGVAEGSISDLLNQDPTSPKFNDHPGASQLKKAKGQNEFTGKLDSKGRFTKGTVKNMFGKLSPDAKGVTENQQQVDMTGKKCTSCKKGTYQETSQMDDMDGVLHCTKCNKEVKRHQSAKPKEKGVAEGTGVMPVNKRIAKNLMDFYQHCYSEAVEIQDRMKRNTDRSSWLADATDELKDLSLAFKHSLEAGIERMSVMKQEGPQMYRWIIKSIKSFTEGEIDLPVMIQQELANKKKGMAEGKKVDRFVGYVEKSEEKAGKSKKDAENIAWATANKRGMLDNKNKKKVKEDSIADQTARDSQTMAQAFRSGQMKPKEYAPGEISLSQIYSHPKWRETVQAMAKKYPPDYTNQEVDQPAQIAAREAIKRMIQQGNIQEGLSRELGKWMKSTSGKRISEAGESNKYAANGFVGSDTGGGAFTGYRSQRRQTPTALAPPPATQYQKGPAPANPPETQ